MNSVFNIFIFAIIATNVCLNDGKSKTSVPEQIHLSLGANPTEMMVTFTTFRKSDDSLVAFRELSEHEFRVSQSRVTYFRDKKYKAFIHRAKLTGLTPGATYEYKCKTDGQYSDSFSFKVHTPDTPLKVAIYGDLGLKNGVSTPKLKNDVQKGLYDTIFHIGDIAYNLNSDDGSIGDDFMNHIESIAANVPYQVCAGNHEKKRNFTHYLNRFSMIDSRSGRMNNHYYSQDMGFAHFIFFSSEHYFYPKYFTESHIKWQYEWLENDLREANKPHNRAKRPWIITLAHRPMYCVENNERDCFENESFLRRGRSGDELDRETNYGLEDLFYRHGVDIQFYGHKHLYERSYPLYNLKSSKRTDIYTNPKAPIHITTGVAGTTNRPNSDIEEILPDWVAFYSRDYGYTRMNVQNKTHLLFEQYSAENDKIVDQFVVTKDKQNFPRD